MSGRALTPLLLSAMVLAGSAARAENAAGDGAIEAVQERTYKMSLELNLGVGTAPLDPFTKSYLLNLGAVIHFTDTLAWQAVHVGFCSFGSFDALNVHSSLRDQLERDFGILPTAFEELRYYADSDLIWSPFYGKSSVLNRFSVSYEGYFVLGVGVFKFAKNATVAIVPDSPGINFGLGLRVFHTQHFSYRLDVTDTFGTTFRGTYNVLLIQLAVGLNVGTSE